LAVGRQGPRNTFVAVHVPGNSAFEINQVTMAPTTSQDEDAMTIRIAFANGRFDEVVLRPEVDRAGKSEQNMLRARIEHVATATDGHCVWRYTGDDATSTRSWRSHVIDASRKESGATANGFRVAGWSLPGDAPPPDLLHVRVLNRSVQSYSIRK